MQIRNLTFKHANLTFNISIRSKVTLLQGNSGTGKTVLIDNVANRERFENVATWSTSTGVSVLDFAKALAEESVLFLDEDAIKHVSRRSQLVDLWRLPIYLVIASRRPLRAIAYSYTDCYVLETKNGVTVLKNKYQDYSVLPACNSYVCEDSGAGFEYYDNWLPNVVSSHGNRNLLKYPNAEAIIADGSAIGCFMPSLVKSGTKLFLPISFEQLLVLYFTHYNAQYFLRAFSAKYLTWERFYTAFCQRSDNPLGFRYTKSHLNAVVFNEPILRELKDRSSKRMSTVTHKRYLTAPICNKADSKSAVQSLLLDLGKPSLFTQVYENLPAVLESDTFVDLVLSLL